MSQRRVYLQDSLAGTMHFSLARPGMLKHFEGQWTVTAVEGDTHMSCTLTRNRLNCLLELSVSAVLKFHIMPGASSRPQDTDGSTLTYMHLRILLSEHKGEQTTSFGYSEMMEMQTLYPDQLQHALCA